MDDNTFSRERLEKILQFVSEGIICQEKDGKVSFANNAACTILGLNCQDHTCSDSISAFFSLIREDGSLCPDSEHPTFITFSTGKKLNNQVFGRVQPGRPTIWLSINTHPIFCPGQQLPQAVVNSFTDISEQKRLQKSQANVRIIANESPGMASVGLWEWDVKNQIINWSRGMYSIHDFNLESASTDFQEMIKMSLDCYDQGDRQTILSLFERCLGKGEPYDIECGFTTRRGRKLWVRTMAHAMTKDGEIIKVLGCLMDLSEGKRAEENLKAENLRRLILMDTSRDGIAIINQNHRVVEANFRFAGMLGYTMEEVHDLHTWDFEANMTEGEVRESFKDLTKTNVTFQTKHHRKDGTVYDVEVCATGAMVFGEPMVLTISRDITDRKIAEEGLRQSEEKFRLAFQTSPDPNIIIRMSDDHIVDINKGVTDIFGFSREEVLGRTFLEMNFWFDCRDQHRLSAALAANGMVRSMETMLVRKNGRETPVLASAAVFTLNGENHLYFSARVVEEQKRAEKQLRASEERNRQILQTTMDGFCRVDHQGRILEVNQSYCRMIGYDAQELLAMHVADLETAKADDLEVQLLAIVEKGESRFEGRQRRKDGSFFDVEVSAQCKATDDGVEFVSFLRDVTERKRNERVLRQQHELSLQLSHAATVAETLHLVLVAAINWSGLECGGIYLLDQSTGGLGLADHQGLSPELLAEAWQINPGDPRLDLALQGCATYLNLKELQKIQPGLGDKLCSLAIVPILSQERVIACLNLGSSTNPEISTNVRSIVESLSAQLGGYLARALMESDLRESRVRYSALFEYAPISIWEEDFSAIKTEFDRLRSEGTTDFEVYFANRPEEVLRFVDMARILRMNQESLAMFQVVNVDELARNLSHYFDQNSLLFFQKQLVALARGDRSFQSEIPLIDPKGRSHEIFFRLVVCPGFEHDLSRVLVSFLDITERKQAVAERRKTNEQMTALFNATFDSVILLDTDCRILAINQHGAMRRRKRPEELVGHLLCDFLPIPLADFRKEKIREIIKTGQSVSFDEERDGRFYYVNMAGVNNGEGEIVQVASFSRDITERKQAEDLLRQSNRELHAINECRKALIHAKDINDLLQSVCRIICDEAGYRMAWVCMVDGDDFKSFRAVAWHGHEDGYLIQKRSILLDPAIGPGSLQTAFLAGRTEYVDDFATDDKAAPWRHAALARGYRSSIYLPLKDEHGKAFGTINIYSTRPASFTPKETVLLEGLANDLSYGIGFLRVRTEQDRNNHVNQARADLIQFAQSHSLSALLEKTLNVAEALTGSCIGFYHFIDQEKGKIALQEWSTRTKAEFCAIEEGIESHYDIAAAGVWVDCFHQRKPVIHNDYTALPHRKGLPPGHAEVIKYLAVPVFRGDQIKAILAVGNKVDPYSQKDIDIVLLLADLAWEIVERKIGEDKRQEIESQFRQAQKMEAIGTLAGGIAHDFNNILSAIIGYSEMAYDDALNSQANPSDIAQVLAAAERAKALVKQILTFSRKVEVNFKPLDLNKQVGQAVELLNKTIPKMIDLRTQLADDLWTINADPNQIEQILLNLTVNAADAMNGEGTITLKTTNRMVHDLACITCGKLFSGSHVALEVADTGAGMDEKTLRHIFEPFYTTKEVGKGTGLGLSTVYGIVIGHQGHIICSSSPGKGSIFTIFFPAMQAEPNTTIADLLAANTDTIHKGAERILVVDDEEAILNLATRQLTRAGYNVLTANCGETALKIYREQGTTLDLVVLDLSMPGIGGYKTVQELISINPNIKVIIASGYAANGQITESLDSGAAAYVAKPFKQAELLTAVRRVLDNT